MSLLKPDIMRLLPELYEAKRNLTMWQTRRPATGSGQAYDLGEIVVVDNGIKTSKAKVIGISKENLHDIKDADLYLEGIGEYKGIVDVACQGGTHVEITGVVYGLLPDYDLPHETSFEVFKDIWDLLPYKAPNDWESNPVVYVYTLVWLD